MSEVVTMSDNQPLNHLPPRDVWMYDPDATGLIETPLDERGLVDLDKLVKLVKDTIDPSFAWKSSFNDVHHLQWFANLYHNDNAQVSDEMSEFRELISRKAFIPRVFHNWIHRITEHPPVPSREVIKYSIDAQRVAMSLARTASLAVRLTRMARIPEKKLTQRLDQEFYNYNVYIENARDVPKEFSLLAIEEVEARNPEEMLLANKKLGKLALDRVPIRDRLILRAA